MKNEEYITASEIGEYLYCQRSWWYKRRGIRADPQGSLKRGNREHEAIFRQVEATERAGVVAQKLLLALLGLLALVVVSKLLLGW